MYPKLPLSLLLLLSLGASEAAAQGKRVVTYIEDIQEERKSTRWTLTEWLRIKERMKLMDVWLAMFSDPKKDKFAPELSLSYGPGAGQSRFTLGSTENFADDRELTEDPHRQEAGRVQFWFTNLVSSTTGLRTLDVDLGLEANFMNRFMGDEQTLTAPIGGLTLMTDTDRLQMGGVNLRIFGANVQDSTLVLKAGKFTRSTGYIEEPWQKMDGSYYGGEMALYFLKFLGAEGNYYSFDPATGPVSKGSGTHLEYGGFLELFNIRLGYTLYDRKWSFETEELRLDSRDKGQNYFIRLYF